MEGLAITPNGQYLVGFEQSPLIQDGGDGGRANRIVRIDINTGVVEQFVYDNFLTDKNKSYNSSEILAINSHEFLVLERDGKGLGDGSNAAVKRLYKIDLNGAQDISLLNGGAGISGEANLLTYAVSKSLFLDIRLALNSAGYTDAQIPAKIEGAAWGQDIVESGTTYNTLILTNDNDFLPGTAARTTSTCSRSPTPTSALRSSRIIRSRPFPNRPGRFPSPEPSVCSASAHPPAQRGPESLSSLFPPLFERRASTEARRFRSCPKSGCRAHGVRSN